MAGNTTAKVIERFLLERVSSVFQVISCSTYWGSPSRAVQLLGKRFAAGVESVGLPVSEGHSFLGRWAVHLPDPVRVYTCQTWREAGLFLEHWTLLHIHFIR